MIIICPCSIHILFYIKLSNQQKSYFIMYSLHGLTAFKQMASQKLNKKHICSQQALKGRKSKDHYYHYHEGVE